MNTPVRGGRQGINARNVCLLLILLHLGAFTASLLSSEGPFWLWRGAGFAAVGVAVVSAALGVGFSIYGAIRSSPAFWQWGVALLIVNVVPYALILVVAELGGF
jgi:hypothetical protein